MADYKRATAATQKCTLCIDSPSRPKHLLVALGTAAYLMLPPTRRLVPGHCCIVPIQVRQSLVTVSDSSRSVCLALHA